MSRQRSSAGGGGLEGENSHTGTSQIPDGRLKGRRMQRSTYKVESLVAHKADDLIQTDLGVK